MPPMQVLHRHLLHILPSSGYTVIGVTRLRLELFFYWVTFGLFLVMTLRDLIWVFTCPPQFSRRPENQDPDELEHLRREFVVIHLE
jgi:hypothetical protein